MGSEVGLRAGVSAIREYMRKSHYTGERISEKQRRQFTREKLERDVQAFLDAGGKIEQLPPAGEEPALKLVLVQGVLQ